MSARDPAVTSAILHEHETMMRARLAEIERIIEELQHGLPAASTPAHITETEALDVLQLQRAVPMAELWSWIERAARILCETAGEHRQLDESISALYPPALEDDAIEDVVAFVVINEPFFVGNDPEGCQIGELPGGQWASLVHTDGFASVGDTYRLLGAWVGRNMTPRADCQIWERYPRLGTQSGSPTDGLIEIRWPIE